MKNSLRSLLSVSVLFAAAASFAHAAPADSAPALTDANIAAIVVAANTIDIKAGKLAQKTTHNADVKGLADMMVRDHTAVNEQAVALVTKLKVTPQDNDLSRKLKSDAEKTYASLKAKSGAEFDRAYTANEIAYHQAVISVVETMLIPGAQNAELKALLEQVLPALKTHLEHAQHVQAQLQ
jgi:putative membrane protein